MIDTQTHYRTCNICEAMCGLEIKHRGQKILSIKSDNDDPFSLISMPQGWGHNRDTTGMTIAESVSPAATLKT